MRAKAIKNLAELTDKRFFEEVSKGLSLILENAVCIIDDSIFLATQNHHRTCDILRGIAEEETAKFLILMDAIRCPRQSGNNFDKQLERFDDHLAKGIYAQYYTLRPANFAEVLEYTKNKRQEYYLDGPNNVDWIFRNWILQQREEKIYVDYIKNDGKYYWQSPKTYGFIEKGNTIFCKMPSEVLEFAKALHASGFTDPEALEVIATIWRPVKMTNDFSIDQLHNLNYTTLEELDKRGFLREQSQNIYSLICNRWLFPLHSIDLKEIEVDKSKLCEIQKNWTLES